MPKRPCALVITEDDSTIISADKFGDVYSLPILPLETTGDFSVSEGAVKLTPQVSKSAPSKPFVPAANDFTVHSQRNRKALENQKRQTNQSSEKLEPSFEHRLLLGHVSMLTDITLVALESRNYIITADRDEHIRISRGIPQTHITEGYCLGHSEFVSRLCIPKERSNLLISGGGDDDLFVWEFKSGKLVSRTNLRSHVIALVQDLDHGRQSGKSGDPSYLAVSGIFHMRQNNCDGFEDVVIATCEGRV
jgi:tRNA (guanine-N(7)-)-methyltransferase subunit TRM82